MLDHVGFFLHCITFLILSRMGWPELLGHPFWLEAIREQEDAEEDEDSGEEMNQEEENSCFRCVEKCVCMCPNSPALIPWEGLKGFKNSVDMMQSISASLKTGNTLIEFIAILNMLL